MFAFQIKVKTNNKLSEASRKLVVPLQNIAKELAMQIKQRVLTGKDPLGNDWSRLSRKSGESGDSKTSKKDQWWVSPTDPQPAGYLFKIPPNAKSFANFVIYRNYQEFVNRSEDGNKRNWHKSGKFWDSIAVRPQSANKVKIIASGGRVINGKRIANRDIGYYAGRDEKFRVLSYSASERKFVVDFIRESIDEQMRIRMGTSNQIDNVSNRIKKANLRVKKLT